MESAIRLSTAQSRFLQVCLEDPQGRNSSPNGKVEASAWDRTARALTARGLVKSEDQNLVIIVEAGREVLGRVLMRTPSIGNLEAWKLGCRAAVLELGLPVDDLWADDDPYELVQVADEAFGLGRTPMSFVEETFEEDLARQAGDDEEYRQSLEQDDGFEEFEEE